MCYKSFSVAIPYSLIHIIHGNFFLAFAYKFQNLCKSVLGQLPCRCPLQVTKHLEKGGQALVYNYSKM